MVNSSSPYDWLNVDHFCWYNLPSILWQQLSMGLKLLSNVSNWLTAQQPGEAGFVTRAHSFYPLVKKVPYEGLGAHSASAISHMSVQLLLCICRIHQRHFKARYVKLHTISIRPICQHLTLITAFEIDKHSHSLNTSLTSMLAHWMSKIIHVPIPILIGRIQTR